jgi:hypothetical protein
MGLNACCGFSFRDEFLVLQLKSGGEPPQSKRSANFSDAQKSRSVWTACASAPLFGVRHYSFFPPKPAFASLPA